MRGKWIFVQYPTLLGIAKSSSKKFQSLVFCLLNEQNVCHVSDNRRLFGLFDKYKLARCPILLLGNTVSFVSRKNNVLRSGDTIKFLLLVSLSCNRYVCQRNETTIKQKTLTICVTLYQDETANFL